MDDKSARTVFVVNDAIMILYGVSAVMIGTTLPEMIESLDLSLARGGLLVSVQSAGGVLSMIGGALVADRVSKPRWTLGSFVALGLVLVAVGFTGGYAGLVTLFFVAGVAVRLLDIMLNAYTGDVAGDDRGRALNLLHMFFSVGAFLGPLIAGTLLSAGLNWRVVYRIVGVTYVAACAAATPVLRSYGVGLPTVGSAASSALPGTRGGPTRRPMGERVKETFGRPEIAALGVVLLLYAVHQTGTTAWLPLYLETRVGVGEAAAGAGLSAYWIGIIGSRFTASRLARLLGPRRILIVGAVVGGAATIAGLVAPGVGPLVGVVIAGYLTGATIPLVMTVAYGILPSRTGSVTAVLSVFMLIGRLVGPWMIGSLADRAGIGSAMIVVGVSLVAAGVAALPAKNDQVDSA